MVVSVAGEAFRSNSQTGGGIGGGGLGGRWRCSGGDGGVCGSFGGSSGCVVFDVLTRHESIYGSYTLFNR